MTIRRLLAGVAVALLTATSCTGSSSTPGVEQVQAGAQVKLDTLIEAGGGHLVVDPPGVAHPSGSTVTISAVPLLGYRFAGWADELGTENPLTLVLDTDTVLTARFESDRGAVAGDGTTLAVTEPVNGAIVAEPPLASVPPGTLVTLTAVPAIGYEFVEWGGDLDTRVNPITVVNRGLQVAAAFAQLPPAAADEPAGPLVEVAVNPSAGGSVSADGDLAALPRGTPVTLSATPEPGFVFTGWTGDVASTANPLVLTPTEDRLVTPHFAPAPPDGGPLVEIWTPSPFVIGPTGRAQDYVNVLGRVTDPDGLVSLTYQLGDHPLVAARVGPDQRRLDQPGDFNLDVPIFGLAEGDTTLTLTATDRTGASASAEVVIRYQPAPSPPLPFSTDWATATSVHDRAQPVDGRWSVAGGAVSFETPGYDRLIAVGDTRWADYEVTLPFVVDGFGPDVRTGVSGPALVGVGLRWTGHTGTDIGRPVYEYFPTGAFGWYHFLDQPRLEAVGNYNQPQDHSYGTVVELGARYWLRGRAEGRTYRFKMWKDGDPEPGWQVEIDVADGPAEGAVVLVANHVDATFGDVVVTGL